MYPVYDFMFNFNNYYYARCDCYPGVCNKLMTIYVAKYAPNIRRNLSTTVYPWTTRAISKHAVLTSKQING